MIRWRVPHWRSKLLAVDEVHFRPHARVAPEVDDALEGRQEGDDVRHHVIASGLFKNPFHGTVSVKDRLLPGADDELRTFFDFVLGPFVKQDIIPEFFPLDGVFSLSKPSHMFFLLCF